MRPGAWRRRTAASCHNKIVFAQAGTDKRQCDGRRSRAIFVTARRWFIGEGMTVRRFTTSALLLLSVLPASCAREGEKSGAPAATEGGDRAAGVASTQPCVNLNRATAGDLNELLGIGAVKSRCILEF